MSWTRDPRERDRLYRRLRRRDGDACQICRAPIDFNLRGTDLARAPSIDHFVPRSAGGSNRVNNLRLTHIRCNTDRLSDGWIPTDVPAPLPFSPPAAMASAPLAGGAGATNVTGLAIFPVTLPVQARAEPAGVTAGPTAAAELPGLDGET